MPTLVIVESPEKAKKIGQILGANYWVKASIGHIRDLPPKDLGIDLQTFDATYVPMPGKAKVISTLKNLANKADDVILATDMDREGEAIAWHLEAVLKLKNPKRITYGEITHTAILSAIANARSIDYARVDAQKGRRLIDRLVGWMVSQAISKQRGQKLSAGRVQSVAVRLITERCDAIRQFVPTDHLGVRLIFSAGNQKVWKAKWQPKLLLPDGESYWLDEDFAERVAAIEDVRVITCETETKREAPPPPLTTSTMIQLAATELKMTSATTMATAQKLYEQGLISYHRTDLPNLSNDAFADISRYAQSHDLPVVHRKRTWTTSAAAQEAHEAIRPTHFDTTEAGMDDDQQQLYRIIWTRAVCSQLEAAQWTVRKVQLKASELLDGKKINFQATGRILTFPGWRQLLKVQLDAIGADESEQLNNPIPELQPGQELQSIDGQVLNLSTTAPPFFTEASLVKELEKRGIGRPSTYASIIATIVKRQYVELQKNKFHDTELGQTVMACMLGQFSFMEYDFTCRMEALLDAIARSETPLLPVVRGFYARLQSELNVVAAAPAFPCPDCGQPLRRFEEGKYGPWWGCTGFDNGCRIVLPDNNGRPGQRKPKSTEHPCPSCNIGHLRRLVKAATAGKKGYDFWVCSTDDEICSFKCNTTGDKPACANNHL